MKPKEDLRRFVSIIVMTCAISIMFSLSMFIMNLSSVYAIDDYPQEYKNAQLDTVVDRWNFYNRECTSFVAWCLNSRNGVAFTNQYGGVSQWGHAKYWGTVAKKLNIVVDDIPRVGAIAWIESGSLGHVAWVASVDGDSVRIEEYSHSNPFYNERTVNKTEFKYIHIKDLCTEHKWNHGKITREAKCTKNELIDGEKVYTCTVCGETKTEVITAAHNYKKVGTKAATLEKNGNITHKCSKCGKKSIDVIYRPKTIKVKKSLVAYNGKAQKPDVIVKTAKGKNIPKKYYSVSYKNNRKIGTASATITFNGLYSGSVTKTFKIGPKGTELVKCNGGKNKITLRWKKTSDVSGYQIQYSTGKNFKAKSTKTITVKGNKKVTYVIDKLKNGKKYYARVRTYKTILFKNHYSPWSKVKSVKTKSVSGKEKAISAYRKFLEKENHQSDGFGTYTVEDFAIKDLNGDKSPELLIHGGGRMDYSKIYTYSGGSVKFVHQGTSLNVYSNGIIKIQFSSGSGYWLYSYYRMKGDKTKYEYRYAEWYNDILETGEYTYSEGEKSGNDDSTKVPYANIKKNLSKILDGAKDVTPKYHPNTQANRKKYLK